MTVTGVSVGLSVYVCVCVSSCVVCVVDKDESAAVSSRSEELPVGLQESGHC